MVLSKGKKGGLNCFSFFLLVLGTVPRVFTQDKRSVSSPFFFSYKIFDFEGDLTKLFRKPFGPVAVTLRITGMCHQACRAPGFRGWALLCLPASMLATLLSREESGGYTSWSVHHHYQEYLRKARQNLRLQANRCEGQLPFACLLSSTLLYINSASQFASPTGLPLSPLLTKSTQECLSPLTHKQEAASQGWACAEGNRELLFAFKGHSSQWPQPS